MAVKYKRLPRGYLFDQTEDETTGQEQYIRHDDAAGGIDPAALPAVGTTAMTDPDGLSVATCLCRQKSIRYKDDDPDTPVWTFKFATQKKHPPGKRVDTDPATRSFDAGTDQLTLDNPSAKWIWEGTTGPVEQPITRPITTGGFTIPKGPLTQAEYATWFAIVKTHAGKINDAAFENVFAAGQVRFDGVRGGTTYVDGALRWQFEMLFTFRIINEKDWQDDAITQNDWQYDWNPKAGYAGWDKPKNGSHFKYETADFSTL